MPAYVPDVVAGSSAPIQLTKWKVAALKVLALLHLRGYVVRSDFKSIGIDSRRWIAPGGGFLDHAPDSEAQHPVVFPQIMAEMAKQLGEAA